MISLASEEDCKNLLFLEDHCTRDQNCTFVQEYFIFYLKQLFRQTIAI